MSNNLLVPLYFSHGQIDLPPVRSSGLKSYFSLHENVFTIALIIIHYIILNRTDSSALIQAHCSVGLGIILQKLYKENIRYVTLNRFAFVIK